MIHIHKKTGVEYDVGFCDTFDMSIIVRFPIDPGDEPIRIINYYFGEYDPESTDYYIDEYLKNQESLKSGLKFLEGDYLINCVDGDFLEPDRKKELETSIETLKQLV